MIENFSILLKEGLSHAVTTRTRTATPSWCDDSVLPATFPTNRLAIEINSGFRWTVSLCSENSEYFAWLLELPLTTAFGVLNAMWYGLMDDAAAAATARQKHPAAPPATDALER